MFGRTFFHFIALMLAISLLTNQHILGLISFWFLLVVLAAHLWRKYALSKITIERSLSTTHIFPDTPVEMQLRVINRKFLPLARVDLFDPMPKAIEIAKARFIPSIKANRKVLVRSLSLGWYESLTQHYQLNCPERGLYRLGPISMRTGDPFGFFLVQAELPSTDQIVVYPRLLTPQELPITARQLLGSQLTRQSLLSDPTQIIGIRDYHTHDPLKAIHWSASARRGTLQSRINQPATELEVLCLLDINTFDHVWQGIDSARAEHLISLTATVCQQLTSAGYSVGLATNAMTITGGRTLHLKSSRSPSQPPRLLEALAHVSPYASIKLDRLLRSLPAQINAGTTIILMSAIAPAKTLGALQRLMQHGYPLIWMYTGAQPPRLPGATIIPVPPPEVV